ncbi:MAG: GAF domain-containing sensor histidine kinase [Gemmatimonadota bacterium]
MTTKTLKRKPRSRKKATVDPAKPIGAEKTSAAPSSDHLSLLESVAIAAAEGAQSQGAALLVSHNAPGRYRVAAIAGAPPLRVDELVSFSADRIIRDSDQELPLQRFEAPSSGLPKATNGSAAAGLNGAARSPKDAGKGTRQKKGAAANKRNGPAPALSVPVTLCGRSLGELVVFPVGGDSAPGEAELARLADLTNLAAPAAALRRVDDMEAHLTELGAVVEVGQVLTGLLNMEDVLAYVVYLAESLVGGHCASVALLSEDGSELVIGTSTGSLRGIEGDRIPIGESLIGRVATHGEPVITPDLSRDAPSTAAGGSLGPAVVVPVTSVGKVIGVFIVARQQGARVFPPESVGILQQMAAYTAIAITNAEIHRKQQEIAETLRSQAAELERAYEELNRSQDQLLISEKMAALGRVTAGIAHEINSPLGGILNSLLAARGYVEEYRSSIEEPEVTAEDHQAIAGDILNAVTTAEGAAAKVAQFVKSIKGQTRIGEGETSEFDPAGEVDATVALLQHEMRRRQVAVFTDMDRGNKLTGDQGKFGVVIQNLISNAIDAYSGQPGEIWIRLEKQDDRLIIRVEDKGCGIPEEIRGRIFDYLFTTKDVGQGTGLGLAMVHSVVTSAFKGEISLESKVGEGTTFTVSLPFTSAEANHGA